MIGDLASSRSESPEERFAGGTVVVVKKPVRFGMYCCRGGLALTLAVAAALKLSDIPAASKAVSSALGYPIPPALVILLASLEGGLALGLFIRSTFGVSLMLVRALLLAFLGIHLSHLVANGAIPECGCFGPLRALSQWSPVIAGVLLLVSLLMEERWHP